MPVYSDAILTSSSEPSMASVLRQIWKIAYYTLIKTAAHFYHDYCQSYHFLTSQAIKTVLSINT